jgi:hypothetical protein
LSPATMAVDPTGDSNDTTTPDHLPQHGGHSLSLEREVHTRAAWLETFYDAMWDAEC